MNIRLPRYATHPDTDRFFNSAFLWAVASVGFFWWSAGSDSMLALLVLVCMVLRVFWQLGRFVLSFLQSFYLSPVKRRDSGAT